MGCYHTPGGLFGHRTGVKKQLSTGLLGTGMKVLTKGNQLLIKLQIIAN